MIILQPIVLKLCTSFQDGFNGKKIAGRRKNMFFIHGSTAILRFCSRTAKGESQLRTQASSVTSESCGVLYCSLKSKTKLKGYLDLRNICTSLNIAYRCACVEDYRVRLAILIEMRIKCCQSSLCFPFQCTSVQMSVLVDFILKLKNKPSRLNSHV